MFGWLGKRGGGEPQPIDPGLWESATQPYLFMRGLPAGDDERLRNLAAGFLARKHFSGTHGLELTPVMAAPAGERHPSAPVEPGPALRREQVAALEREVAQLLGTEAAVFMPSGVMAQQGIEF